MCKCECGTIKPVFGKYLRAGKSRSCGCTHKRNWIGERFGRLTIIDVYIENKINIYECLCDCGNHITVKGTSIYNTKSCGCSRRVSHIGEKYGHLTITEMLYNYLGDNVTYVSCNCDCGTVGHIARLEGLVSGNTASCGCTHVPSLVGRKYGRLTVVGLAYIKKKQRHWLCKCECGTQVVKSTNLLTSGKVKSCGCLRSAKYSYAETKLRSFFKNNGIEFSPEHSFDDCRGIGGKLLRFDFFLPRKQIAIECDGEQHYRPFEYFGGFKSFIRTQVNDQIKNNYCKSHDIRLIRLPYYMSEEEIETTLINSV